MDRVEEIKHALGWLPDEELNSITDWLRARADNEGASEAVAEPASANALRTPSYVTIDEYFELEEVSQIKHEYINGAVYAMSGASLAHVSVANELLVACKAHLRGGPCRAFGSDAMLRIFSETEDIMYYPDLVVACNKEEWGKNYVRNPKLVVEVLSPSTEHIDRREKATNYRRVTSIEEYILVEQDEYRVTVHRRAENWTPQVYVGREGVVEFRSICLTIPLAQIYVETL
jgi:Uma2 family endonuclease